MKKIVVNDIAHLCLFATKAIEVGDELRYDYFGGNICDTKELYWRKVCVLK